MLQTVNKITNVQIIFTKCVTPGSDTVALIYNDQTNVILVDFLWNKVWIQLLRRQVQDHQFPLFQHFENSLLFIFGLCRIQITSNDTKVLKLLHLVM